MNVASTGAVDLGTTTLLADTAVGDGVDYTINASGASDRHTLDFASNDGAMDIEINSLANDVTLDVAMNDVRQADRRQRCCFVTRCERGRGSNRNASNLRRS